MGAFCVDVRLIHTQAVYPFDMRWSLTASLLASQRSNYSCLVPRVRVLEVAAFGGHRPM